jgi:hypothetical protein
MPEGLCEQLPSLHNFLVPPFFHDSGDGEDDPQGLKTAGWKWISRHSGSMSIDPDKQNGPV